MYKETVCRFFYSVLSLGCTIAIIYSPYICCCFCHCRFFAIFVVPEGDLLLPLIDFNIHNICANVYITKQYMRMNNMHEKIFHCKINWSENSSKWYRKQMWTKWESFYSLMPILECVAVNTFLSESNWKNKTQIPQKV